MEHNGVVIRSPETDEEKARARAALESMNTANARQAMISAMDFDCTCSRSGDDLIDGHKGYCEGQAAARGFRAAIRLTPTRDPKPDWDAIARLVDAEIRRGEITASRGAEIMGLRLQTWRDWGRELGVKG